MKSPRRLLVLICIGVLVCACLWFFAVWLFSRPGPAPAAAMSFLGFTNASGGNEALFALSNPPPAAVSLHSVQPLRLVANNPVSRNAGSFSWGRREEWGLRYAISVNSTNEPLQVVFRFQLRAVGPRRLVEQCRELLGRITGDEREFFTGSISFVTNETRSGNTLP